MGKPPSKSRRYGGRFSSPNPLGWNNGNRHNPARKRKGRRNAAKQVVVKGKA